MIAFATFVAFLALLRARVTENFCLKCFASCTLLLLLSLRIKALGELCRIIFLHFACIFLSFRLSRFTLLLQKFSYDGVEITPWYSFIFPMVLLELSLLAVFISRGRNRTEWGEREDEGRVQAKCRQRIVYCTA